MIFGQYISIDFMNTFKIEVSVTKIGQMYYPLKQLQIFLKVSFFLNEI